MNWGYDEKSLIAHIQGLKSAGQEIKDFSDFLRNPISEVKAKLGLNPAAKENPVAAEKPQKKPFQSKAAVSGRRLDTAANFNNPQGHNWQSSKSSPTIGEKGKGKNKNQWPLCRYFLKGQCAKGAACPYIHQIPGKGKK